MPRMAKRMEAKVKLMKESLGAGSGKGLATEGWRVVFF
jgi:hypothetical protein